jgi:hypothetical protein
MKSESEQLCGLPSHHERAKTAHNIPPRIWIKKKFPLSLSHTLNSLHLDLLSFRWVVTCPRGGRFAKETDLTAHQSSPFLTSVVVIRILQRPSSFFSFFSGVWLRSCGAAIGSAIMIVPVWNADYTTRGARQNGVVDWWRGRHGGFL